MLQKSKVVGFGATSNPDTARKFYGDVLGLKLVEETPFAIVFDSINALVRIQIVEKVHAVPYTLIGWEVEDISAAANKLVALGVKFERYHGIEQDEAGIWGAPDGTKVAWFKDPDGNLLSLSQGA